DLTYKIIGAAMEVHNYLGPGHNEEVYQKALEYELMSQGIAFESQKPVQIDYKGEQVGLRYLDFVVEDKVIVEIKATSESTSLFIWQVLYYFAVTDYPVALLMNFGSQTLEYKRLLPNEKILKYREEREISQQIKESPNR
ncbi:MAG: GxxExxY protein, partial [Candidatus Zixiibacteriota bacterium]